MGKYICRYLVTYSLLKARSYQKPSESYGKSAIGEVGEL